MVLSVALFRLRQGVHEGAVAQSLTFSVSVSE